MVIKIGNKEIGLKNAFIIAEAGVNHNGSLELAKKLIDVAFEAGADAIKFQTFKTENVVTESAEKAEYQIQNTGVESESQYEMIKKLELSEKDFEELYGYCQNKGILFLSTPFDFESADFLDDLVPLFKISSTDLNNLPFLEHVAKKKKPVIISTGMGTLCEIEEAVNTLKNAGNHEIILLHCVTSYPAKDENLNLNVIHTLKNAFKLDVGFSDHSLGIYASIAAVSMGATIIEKHFTLDNELPGPDHKASLNPTKLNELIIGIRSVEKAFGDGVKRLTKEEIEIKKVARRSIVAKKDISENSIITEDMIILKRPGTGIKPKYLPDIIGKKVKKDVKKDSVLLWDDFIP